VETALRVNQLDSPKGQLPAFQPGVWDR
jgi:hypothetical protein